MNKLFKRISTSVLATSIAFSGAVAMVFQSSATGATGNGINISAFADGSQPTSIRATSDGFNSQEYVKVAAGAYAVPIVIWSNGGKIKKELGNTGIIADIDMKTTYVNIDASVNWTNSDGNFGSNLMITASKNIFWGKADVDNKICTIDSDGKIVKGSDGTVVAKTNASTIKLDGAFKASGGKLTGKLSDNDGEEKIELLGIYFIDPVSKDYYLLEKFAVQIKQAPKAIIASTKSDGSSEIKNLPIGVNQTSDALYATPKSTAKAHKDSTYIVSVDAKSKDFVAVTLSSDGSNAKNSINISENCPFYIKGLKTASKTTTTGTTYSAAKATVIITNAQSGKTAKISVTVNNSATVAVDGSMNITESDGKLTVSSAGVKPYSVTSGGVYTVSSTAIIPEIKTNSAAAGVLEDFDITNFTYSDGVKDPVANGTNLSYVNKNDFDKGITIKPQVGIFSALDKITFSDKGKLNKETLPNEIKGAKVAINKDNATIKITAPKLNIADEEIAYIAVAYGAKYSETAIIPVKFTTEKLAMETTLYAKVAYSDGKIKGLTSDSAGVASYNFTSDGIKIVAKGATAPTTATESEALKEGTTAKIEYDSAAALGKITFTAMLTPLKEYDVYVLANTTYVKVATIKSKFNKDKNGLVLDLKDNATTAGSKKGAIDLTK